MRRRSTEYANHRPLSYEPIDKELTHYRLSISTPVPIKIFVLVLTVGSHVLAGCESRLASPIKCLG